MIESEKHLENRQWLLSVLAEEIFGPDSRLCTSNISRLEKPTIIKYEDTLNFESWEEYNKLYCTESEKTPSSDEQNLQPIIKEEAPLKKFGLGILYPSTNYDNAKDEQPDDKDTVEQSSIGTLNERDPDEFERDEETEKSQKKLLERAERFAEYSKRNNEDHNEISGEEELRLSNLRKPRALGISFIARALESQGLLIKVYGGRYKKKTVGAPGKSRAKEWWIRLPLKAELTLKSAELNFGSRSINLAIPEQNNLPPLNLELRVVVRKLPQFYRDDYPRDARLITLSLVNETKASLDELGEKTLFQSRFSVFPKTEDQILPYYENIPCGDDEDVEKMNLLYRKERSFSIGHGCTGDWDAKENAEFADAVHAEPLPTTQTPSFTPMLGTSDGEEIKVYLAPLAGLCEGEDGLTNLNLLVNEYETWIKAIEKEAESLDPRYLKSASNHIEKCRLALERMKSGIRLLNENEMAAEAFRLMNKAMLLQSLASSSRRKTTFDPTNRRWVNDKYIEPDTAGKNAKERAWRPFQIAFILMNLESLMDGNCPDRETVELIWFPTGGGKTEAYLGAASFSLFCRRLSDKNDSGTHILMRYTLRLLTSQQFQRAASLICSMESIRMEIGMAEKLGNDSFSIGIWVGGDTSPNKIEQAKKGLREAKRYGEDKYSLVLLRCPWCGIQMGPIKNPGNGSNYILRGVQQVDMTLHCPDASCKFNHKLPVSVIDEKLYKDCPSLVIGTVDKFASLTWRPEARALFGINGEGKRIKSPPGLIIQDELHLITGPLGSVVGLYETLVEELCTDRRGKKASIKPKIVCATATTRASERQILDLFAREKASIFPASGLSADDSFFAKYDRESDGSRKPGRLYLGVNPINFSSPLTSEVRCFSTILSAAKLIEKDEEQDPWWSLLVFHKSLRELGAGLTLFAADIPERLRFIQNSWAIEPKKMRYIYAERVLELTGRLSNSEVPQALERLENKKGESKRVVDACLASNIIEVGVDVDRLGVMGVIGQPKTTAQYIQATGRVGRTLGKPGLILTLYNTGKPRDRSIYEQFRSYHSRIYSRVEPSSVTPFTQPVLERALHGVLCAWIRQFAPLDKIFTPLPIPEETFEQARKGLLNRINLLGSPSEEERQKSIKVLEKLIELRKSEWEDSKARRWELPEKDRGDSEQPLLRRAGEQNIPPEFWDKSWSTPSSMRGVDAECQPVISSLYTEEFVENAEDSI